MIKILIFTEGTILMHGLGIGLSREERVRQSKEFALRLLKSFQFYRILRFFLRLGNQKNSVFEEGAIDDYNNYVSIDGAVNKIKQWKNQGAVISYLTSRRIKSEVEAIKEVLQKFQFPDSQNLFFRQTDEDYHQVAERIEPDILIEDDCESIGGEKEMTITFIKPEIKKRIKSIVVKEFDGIDHLPDNLEVLRTWVS